MIHKQIILSLLAFSAGGMAAMGYHWTRTAGACGTPQASTSAPTSTAPSPESAPADSCTLTPGDRNQALESFRGFSKAHLKTVDAAVTATFTGDKSTIGTYLNAAIKREAACCSFLRFELTEVDEGYRVTMRANGQGVGELAAALKVMGLQ